MNVSSAGNNVSRTLKYEITMKLFFIITTILLITGQRVNAQDVLKKIEKEREKIRQYSDDIKKYRDDSVSDAGLAKKYANELKILQDKDKRLDSEISFLNGTTARIELKAATDSLGLLENETAQLRTDSGQLAVNKEDLAKRSAPVSDNDIRVAEQRLSKAVGENEQLKNDIAAITTEVNAGEQRQKDFGIVTAENEKLTNMLISQFNESADAVVSREDLTKEALITLDNDKKKLLALGIDEGKLKNYEVFRNYCQAVSSARDMLDAVYNQQAAQRNLGALTGLNRDKALSGGQRRKLNELIDLINNYCAATGECWKVIEENKRNASPELVFNKLAKQAIDQLMRNTGIMQYPFLQNELQRLAGKYNKDKGWNDSKIPPCR